MMSQTELQTISIHIIPNISRSKYNQTVKVGQLIEHNTRNIFFKNYEENEAGRLVPNLFLFFKKVLCKVKTGGQHLSFNKFW